jgi:hypothetical protein
VLTNHEKICTIRIPGVTQCSREECEQHCATTDSFACTHWAYDVAEMECYIFEGCVDQGFDEDYVQYAMVDPTCERTLDGYPLGCEKRRCNKNININTKICAAKSGSACTVEQCRDKCESHIDFTCTTYSIDPSNGDCYLWETCLEEGPEADYNTYVLVDPTCGMSFAEGGCPERLCSMKESDNDNMMVCSGTAAGMEPCSAKECNDKCASQGGCTHHAYDSTDSECILFASCDVEAFNDDFALFKMPTLTVLSGSFAAPTAGCSKTVEEGGCPNRRCSKKTNEHNKICNAGVDECSSSACEAKCRAHTDFACTHWAHEEAEMECYLFDGCNDESDDTYIQYLLGPCSKTMEEGGCPNRRCSKSNSYNKICNNGVDECSASECEAKCRDHTDFPCTHYAHEEAEMECYLFDGCDGESEDTYIQYLLAAPKVCRDATGSLCMPSRRRLLFGDAMTMQMTAGSDCVCK